MIVKLRIIYFHVKMRIIFHLFHAQMQTAKMTVKRCYMSGIFREMAVFSAGNRNPDMVFFDQEFAEAA